MILFYTQKYTTPTVTFICQFLQYNNLTYKQQTDNKVQCILPVSSSLSLYIFCFILFIIIKPFFHTLTKHYSQVKSREKRRTDLTWLTVFLCEKVLLWIFMMMMTMAMSRVHRSDLTDMIFFLLLINVFFRYNMFVCSCVCVCAPCFCFYFALFSLSLPPFDVHLLFLVLFDDDDMIIYYEEF